MKRPQSRQGEGLGRQEKGSFAQSNRPSQQKQTLLFSSCVGCHIKVRTDFGRAMAKLVSQEVQAPSFLCDICHEVFLQEVLTFISMFCRQRRDGASLEVPSLPGGLKGPVECPRIIHLYCRRLQSQPSGNRLRTYNTDLNRALPEAALLPLVKQSVHPTFVSVLVKHCLQIPQIMLRCIYTELL